MFPTKNTSEFKERVDVLVRRAGSMLRLSRLTGMSDRAIAKWRSGEAEPSRENLEKLAAACDVHIAWLVSGIGPMDAADTGSEHHEPAVSNLNVSLKMLPLLAGSSQDTFLFTVNDHSMEPTLHIGDRVLIDKMQTSPHHGGIYMLYRDDVGEYVLRRLQRLLNGHWRLLCDNPVYFSEEFLPDLDPGLEILGRAIWCGRAL